jgi:hypothetical protein
MEVAPSTAPNGRLAATTSCQRRPSLSRDARSHLPAKEEATGTAEAVHRGRDLTWTGTKPVTTFVVARTACGSTLAVTSRQSKRAPTAVQGKIAEAIWKGLRPSHRRGFRLAIYLWHSPTLANLKHLADRRGRADNARTASTRHRKLTPASQELPSLAVNINSQVTLVSGITRGFA